MFELIRIDCKKTSHIRILYILLSKRKYSISHKKLPSYLEHKNFVNNSPYRVWYLIKNINSYIGSIYISNENVIGLNVDFHNSGEYIEILKILLNIHKPLKPINSIRNSHFVINVSPHNKVLLDCMNKIGMEHIQTSFLIKTDKLN